MLRQRIFFVATKLARLRKSGVAIEDFQVATELAMTGGCCRP